jgi:hypothetical protein
MVTVADAKSATPADAGEERRGEFRVVDMEDLRVRRAIMTALFRRWENIRDELEIMFGPPATL